MLKTKNESAAEVAGIIVDELNRLGTTDIAESELVPRKAALIGNFGRSLETGLAMNSKRLPLRASASGGNTRVPRLPTTIRAPSSTAVIATHRAAEPSGSMAMPQSIS